MSILFLLGAQRYTCPICSTQSPILGINGSSYNLQKHCCADGTIWIKFGRGNQGSMWIYDGEVTVASDFEVGGENCNIGSF